MKKLLVVFLFLFVGYNSFSQVIDSGAVRVDSSIIKPELSFSAKHLGYIISFIKDKGTIDAINLINEMKVQLDTSYNPDQVIVVHPTSAYVVERYTSLGNEVERLTSTYNNDIKDALIPQVYQYSWIMRMLQTFTYNNTVQTEQKVMQGINFVKALK